MLLTTELDKLSGTDWQLFFAQERAKPYFAELDAFVTAAAAEKTVYPAAENIFAAFRACPVSAVRVVILGQDPYHEPGQAMGLSFSVPDGCKAPPSLRNIFKELEAELGPGCAAHTDLTLWARQGVLLLNTVLTVEQGAANAMRAAGGRRLPVPRWNTPPPTAPPRWPPCCGASPRRSTRRFSTGLPPIARCWCWNPPTPARCRPTAGSSARRRSAR